MHVIQISGVYYGEPRFSSKEVSDILMEAGWVCEEGDWVLKLESGQRLHARIDFIHETKPLSALPRARKKAPRTS